MVVTAAAVSLGSGCNLDGGARQSLVTEDGINSDSPMSLIGRPRFDLELYRYRSKIRHRQNTWFYENHLSSCRVELVDLFGSFESQFICEAPIDNFTSLGWVLSDLLSSVSV